MKTISVFCIFLLSSMGMAKKAPSSSELISQYPQVSPESRVAENKEILCPFLRMLHRSGIFDSLDSSTLVAITKLSKAAKKFGCRYIGCGSVATLASTGQVFSSKEVFRGHAKAGHINLERLHKAKGIAHDCGLTFAKGGTKVSDARRQRTLDRLRELSDSNGRLSQDDLMLVKKETCRLENVKMSAPGKFEVGLIFNYLGGKDRGYVDFDDVVKLFHATMPAYKTLKFL